MEAETSPPPSHRAALAAMIKEARACRQVTQRVMADELGVQTGTYWKWESGEVIPPASAMLRIFGDGCVPSEAWFNAHLEREGVTP